MANQTLHKALEVLVVIDRRTVSSFELAEQVGVSRPTALRLIESLRQLGCKITSERDGYDYWYALTDWGIFSPARVKAYVQVNKISKNKVE